MIHQLEAGLNRQRRYWPVLLFLLAALLRLTTLGVKSLWVDEAFVVWKADLTPAAIWAEPYDNHPPLYFLLLHGWLAISRSEFWLRLPSVITSLAGLGLLYWLGRRLFDRPVALLATALLALSPLDLWYAQEARMVLFVTPPALLLALGLSRQDARGGLLIAVGLGAGLYFDYTIIPLWVVLSAVWLGQWWQNGRSPHRLLTWAAASLLGWLSFWPLWWHLGGVLERMGGIFIFANLSQALGLPNLTTALLPLLLLGLAATAAAGSLLLQRLLHRPTWQQLLTLLMLSGFLTLTLLTPIPRLYSLKRIIVTGWPFVILLAAWLLSRLSRPRLTAAFLTLSLLATLTALLVPKDDWRGVVNHINDRAGATDIVWLDPAAGRLPYDYYNPKLPAQFGRGSLANTAATAQVIWHIAERQPAKPIPATPAEDWLDTNWQLTEAVGFYRLELRRYERE